jgi:hypothetical protein
MSSQTLNVLEINSAGAREERDESKTFARHFTFVNNALNSMGSPVADGRSYGTNLVSERDDENPREIIMVRGVTSALPVESAITRRSREFVKLVADIIRIQKKYTLHSDDGGLTCFKMVCQLSISFLDVLQTIEMQNFVLNLHKKIIDFIRGGHKELKYYYNKLFVLHDQSPHKELFIEKDDSEQIPAVLMSKYQELIERHVANVQVHIKKLRPRYAEGQIIGAQDREKRWCMAQILKTMALDNDIWYYVRFIGWGREFNEMIAEGDRLQIFNARRHKQRYNNMRGKFEVIDSATIAVTALSRDNNAPEESQHNVILEFTQKNDINWIDVHTN